MIEQLLRSKGRTGDGLQPFSLISLIRIVLCLGEPSIMVFSGFGHQLLMAPLLDNPALIHNDDFVTETAC